MPHYNPHVVSNDLQNSLERCSSTKLHDIPKYRESWASFSLPIDRVHDFHGSWMKMCGRSTPASGERSWEAKARTSHKGHPLPVRRPVMTLTAVACGIPTHDRRNPSPDIDTDISTSRGRQVHQDRVFSLTSSHFSYEFYATHLNFQLAEYV